MIKTLQHPVDGGRGGEFTGREGQRKTGQGRAGREQKRVLLKIYGYFLIIQKK